MAEADTTQIVWWLQRSRFPDLCWARLRTHADGSADVLSYVSMFAGLQPFQSADLARSDLLRGGYVPLNEMTEDDYRRLDVPKSFSTPPAARTEQELTHRLMFVTSQEAADRLYAMRSEVARRDWAGLEDRHAGVCTRFAGEATTAHIAAVDTGPYELALLNAVRQALEQAHEHGAAAVYAEYDPEADWRTCVRLYRAPLDDPYAFDWGSSLALELDGPTLPAFARYWVGPHQATPAGVGRIVYLAARTLAAAGRACASLGTGSLSIYFGRHDDWDSIVLMNPSVQTQPNIERGNSDG